MITNTVDVTSINGRNASLYDVAGTGSMISRSKAPG